MTEPYKAMGIEVHVDPTLPPDRIEFRDPTTGDLLAVWGEDGVFQVLPPRPWRSLGCTTDGGEMWVAPVDTPPPTSYTCPRCHRVSYNPNDARERYCGACHRFEDDDD